MTRTEALEVIANHNAEGSPEHIAYICADNQAQHMAALTDATVHQDFRSTYVLAGDGWTITVAENSNPDYPFLIANA
jgi:hypothetical protein